MRCQPGPADWAHLLKCLLAVSRVRNFCRPRTTHWASPMMQQGFLLYLWSQEASPTTSCANTPNQCLSAVCVAGGRGRSAHHGGQESASALLAEGLLPQRTNPNPLTVLPLSAAPRPKSRAVQSGASDLTRLLLSAPSRGPLPY